MSARPTKSDTAREVHRLLAAQTGEAVAFLVGVMRDEGQKTELRMKAAESILDRACGKASSAAAGLDTDPAPATVIFEGVLEEWSR